MSDDAQPAALKLTMAPTGIGNVVKMYNVTGELTIAGHTTPIKFVSSKTIIDDMSGKQEMSGFLDDASDPAAASGSFEGSILKGDMTLSMNAMGKGSSASLKGDLKKGSDADYTALIAKIK